MLHSNYQDPREREREKTYKYIQRKRWAFLLLRMRWIRASRRGWHCRQSPSDKTSKISSRARVFSRPMQPSPAPESEEFSVNSPVIVQNYKNEETILFGSQFTEKRSFLLVSFRASQGQSVKVCKSSSNGIINGLGFFFSFLFFFFWIWRVTRVKNVKKHMHGCTPRFCQTAQTG
jgi:hypothetical protein